MATGQPNSLPKAVTSSGEPSTSDRPGTPETPARSAAWRELILSPMTSMASGGGPMKVTPRSVMARGEVGVLREEPVARMDGVGPAGLHDPEDGVGVQVALRRGLASEGVGLVGQSDVEGVPVEVGVDGDRGHPQLAAGPDDPDRDLPPVGDENLLQHAAPFESDGRGTVAPPSRRPNTVTARRVCAMPGTRFTDIRRFDTIDSTNRYLLDQARAGAPDGIVAVADHQTAGRGRLGRRWEAPAGANLLVSVLLRPELPGPLRHLAAAVVALAAADATETVTGLVLGIKWPNDLLGPDGRKVAGVLAEADLSAGGDGTGDARPSPGRGGGDRNQRELAGRGRRPPRRAGRDGHVRSDSRPGTRWTVKSCSTPCSTALEPRLDDLGTRAGTGPAGRRPAAPVHHARVAGAGRAGRSGVRGDGRRRDRRGPPGGGHRRGAPDRGGRRRRPRASLDLRSARR